MLFETCLIAQVVDQFTLRYSGHGFCRGLAEQWMDTKGRPRAILASESLCGNGFFLGGGR
jgi:hypothetical protein